MISLTSRRPPPSFFTLLGLRVTSSWALSVLPLGRPGLAGSFSGLAFVGEASTDDDTVVGIGAGISSHSEPDKSSFLRKKGHNLMSMAIESFASDVESGTGEDLTTAVMTSGRGKARRFREGVEEPDAVGFEKSLEMISVGYRE